MVEYYMNFSAKTKDNKTITFTSFEDFENTQEHVIVLDCGYN